MFPDVRITVECHFCKTSVDTTWPERTSYILIPMRDDSHGDEARNRPSHPSLSTDGPYWITLRNA